MKSRQFCFAALLVLTLQPALAWPQQLTVQNEAGKQTVLTRADIESLPRVKITTSVPGSPSTFEGVALKTVLEAGGVSFGEAIRGNRLASCLVVEGSDGYRVVIALPEIDPAFTGKQIVVAFLRDGKPLDNKEGPYRLIIPDEKRMARWVRQVSTLKIVDVH